MKKQLWLFASIDARQETGGGFAFEAHLGNPVHTNCNMINQTSRRELSRYIMLAFRKQ